MFVGRYAAALAAKAAEPRAPLWAYAGACQLLDIGWTGSDLVERKPGRQRADVRSPAPA